jgi:hypothetical protein
MKTQIDPKGGQVPAIKHVFASAKAQRLETALVRKLVRHHLQFREEVTPGLFSTFYDLEEYDEPCIVFSDAARDEFVVAFVSEVLKKAEATH